MSTRKNSDPAFDPRALNEQVYYARELIAKHVVTERAKMTRALRIEILKRDGFRCKLCGATARDTLLHVDHMIPIARGGTSHPINLQALCERCNVAKAARTDIGPMPRAPKHEDATEAILEHQKRRHNWHRNAEDRDECARQVTALRESE